MREVAGRWKPAQMNGRRLLGVSRIQQPSDREVRHPGRGFQVSAGLSVREAQHIMHRTFP